MVVSSRGRGFFEKAAMPVVRAFARAGFSPNTLTFLGLFFTAVSLPFFMMAGFDKSYFLIAALFIMFGGLLDGLDGLLARYTGRQSSMGAFIDSFTDRVSDTLIVVGFMSTSVVDGFLGVYMLAASMLVSYARARGEALDISLKGVGFGERSVRLFAVIIGTLAAYFNPATLFFAAVFITAVSTVTVVQRVWTILSVLKGRGS